LTSQLVEEEEELFEIAVAATSPRHQQ